MNYLEEKYSEKFIIKELVRHTDIGEPSIIMAKTCSEKYPDESFDVIYHLSANDIDRKEEIIDFLKKIDAYDESKLKPEVDDEGYFEDNYCNVILQNKFDEQRNVSNAIFSKWMFETTNFYPSIDGDDVNIDEYIVSVPCSLYACTMIFVEDSEDKEEVVREAVKKLLVKEIDRQFIYIHFTEMSKEFIEEEFRKNYDDAVMYFKNAEYVTGYEDIFIKKGEIQNN